MSVPEIAIGSSVNRFVASLTKSNIMAFDLLSPSTLLAGGAVAAIAGFWSQFKSLLSYLSSFLVIQASLDSNLADIILRYIKQHYNKAPSGLHRYIGLYLPARDGNYLNIPFRSLSKTTLFFNRRQLLLVVLEGDINLKVMAIRGNCSFEDLINKALNYHESTLGNSVQMDRFEVIKVMGQEKGPWNNAGSQRTTSGTGVEVNAPIAATANSGDLRFPDRAVDVSFRYDKNVYTFSARVDPFRSLFYDDHIYEYVEEAKKWLHSQRWYMERSIPWKRGWMIYGPGGTGKSSLTLALAKTLQIPVYQYMLPTLSDQEFVQQWSLMRTPCIALFEDFDTVFNKRVPLTEHKSLTFDCVLNQISGVSAVDGVFLVVTTNHIENVDEAMGVSTSFGSISTRPGRIDKVIELSYASEVVRRKIVAHMLKDWPDQQEEVFNKSAGMTAVQVQELCLNLAFKALANNTLQ